MIFYDKNNNKVTIPDEVLTKIISNKGNCGTIYRLNKELCFKYYNKTEIADFILNEDMFQALKTINNPSLVNIKQLLYKDKESKFKAKAYILEYYQSVYDNILTVPSEYLLDSLEKILKLAEELSKENIRVFDLRESNIILTNKNIVLIDPDRWYFNIIENEKSIEKSNINNITGFFQNIIRDNLNKTEREFLIKNNLFDYVIAGKLFPLTSNSDKAIKVLAKRLKGHNRPIDYIYNMRKK